MRAILHDSAYSTNYTTHTRRFAGFPIIFKVYSSSSDEGPYELKAIFSGDVPTDETWGRTQFVFKEPIICKRLKIEFTKVTPDFFFSNNQECPVANEMFFIGHLQYDEVAFAKTSGIYDNANYRNSHIITTNDFVYDTTADKSGIEKKNLFDRIHKSYWVSSNPNSDTFKASVYINFTSSTSIEALVLRSAFSTKSPSRTFNGFPINLRIYTATGQKPLSLHTVFSGAAPTTDDWDLTQFVFKEPITCDRIQIEFYDVTVSNQFDCGGSKTAISGEIEILRYVPDEGIPFYPVSGNLNNPTYVNANNISALDFTYMSNGDNENDHSLSYAFDGKSGKGSGYWVSQEYSDTFTSSIFINFTRAVTLEAILYDPAYSTNKTSNTRRFDGFPIRLNVYTSIDDETFELSAIFSGDKPTLTTWGRTQYAFRSPIYCQRIQMEFAEVTPDFPFSNGKIAVVANEFIFIGVMDPPLTQTPIESPTQSATESPTQSAT